MQKSKLRFLIFMTAYQKSPPAFIFRRAFPYHFIIANIRLQLILFFLIVCEGFRKILFPFILFSDMCIYLKCNQYDIASQTNQNDPHIVQKQKEQHRCKSTAYKSVHNGCHTSCNLIGN